MYELTYDVYLNEDKSSILQPLANASVVTTRMDGYTETGAGNAGLSVGKQEWTTGTVALGGRWMGLVGSNIFGREALAEFRVNAAQDMGDRRGETNVALLGNPGFMQSVRGTKVGTTGAANRSGAERAGRNAGNGLHQRERGLPGRSQLGERKRGLPV